MTALPPFSKDEQNIATLKQGLKEDGTRLYSDTQITNFTPDFRARLVVATEREIIRKSLETQSKTAQDRLAGVAPWDTQPPLDLATQKLLQSQILTSAKIEKEVRSLVPDPDSGEKSPSLPETPSAEEGGGSALGPSEYQPSIEVNIKQRAPQVIAESVLVNLLPQIDPTIDPPKYVLPNLVPVSSLNILDLFMDPVARQMFVVLYTNPTFFFWLGIHIPCGYPIILPAFFPVTPVGKSPAGAIALPFINPDLPYCGGSQPFDVEVIEGAPNVSALKAPIDPCDMSLEYTQLVACIRGFNEQAREILGPLPIPESVRKLMAIIAEKQVFPPADPPRPTVEETIEFIIEDDLERFGFELDIIE